MPRIQIFGRELNICMGALTYFRACPFYRINKPILPLSDMELEALWNRMLEKWKPIVLNTKEFSDVLNFRFSITFEDRELHCLIIILDALWKEIGHSPVELNVILGAEKVVVQKLKESFEAIISHE